MSDYQVLIAGARGGTNVGESLCEGGRSFAVQSELIDTRALSDGPWLLSKLLWHGFHRPVGLGRFQRAAMSGARRLRPRAFVAVGFTLMTQSSVRKLRELGATTVVFLTDDPWNKSQRSRWSLRALPEYDVVVTPRRANIDELQRLGCRNVHYLPFGYDPRLFFEEPADEALRSEVIFVGGADADRAPWIGALGRAGHTVRVYGAYWERFRQTRGMSSGHAGPDVIRRATCSAKVALCLVRRSNRDGHVMRSIEIPAMGTCMLTEDTEEHRALFGAEGECVVYFNTIDEMLRKLAWLLANDSERERLARAAQARIVAGEHSYGHRLQQLLELARAAPAL